MSTQEETQVQELSNDLGKEKSNGDGVVSQEGPIMMSNEGEISQLVEKKSLEDKRNTNNPHRLTKEEKYAAQVEADSRSIFVGNITPDITPEIIEQHFQGCGVLKRITLLYDKNTGAPKGYAYVEFDSPIAQETALGRNGSELKGNLITVYRKRTNLPGYHRNFQYQRPNYYYQHQWNFPYNGYPAYEGINFYPQFEFHQPSPKNVGRFNQTYRGKSAYTKGVRNLNSSKNHPRDDYPTLATQITKSEEDILSKQQLYDIKNPVHISEAASISQDTSANTGQYPPPSSAKDDKSTD